MIRHERRRAQRSHRSGPAAPRTAGGTLALDPGIFSSTNPRTIAATLRIAALRGRRRKSTPFRAAMATLNSYIRRAGESLDAAHRSILERARVELRRQFGKAPRKSPAMEGAELP